MEKLKEFYYINKKIIVISILILLIFIIIILSIYYNSLLNKESKVISKEIEVSKENEIIKEEKNYIVDIKGRVKNPGVYIMKENERVNDVIKKAGGLIGDANTYSINLSKKVYDEMVIIVYSDEEINDFISTKDKEEIINNNCNDDTIIKNDACIVITEDKFNDDEIQKISINTASKEQLMKIPYIGEAKAISIIKYREENNGFKTIEEITSVSGIGESLFEKIKNYITI